MRTGRGASAGARVGRTSLALALIAIGLASPVAAQGPDSARRAARVDAIMREEMAKRRIPGAQYAVVHRGQIVASGALGFANLEHRVPVNDSTRFPINSATKSFTGVAILQLVEAGRVALDAPISRYLDSLPAAWRDIPVASLLAHTSGLPNIVDVNGLIGTGGEAEAWAEVTRRPMEGPRDQRFSYNQTNYVLLARLLNTLGGTPFTQQMQERQFAAAGMHHVVFGDSYDVMANSAQPYSYLRRVRSADERMTDSLGRWLDELPAFMRTAAGITAPARDIARWLAALQRGRLFAQSATLARLLTPSRMANGTDGAWAMGWPVIRTGKHRAFAGIGGGRSAFFLYPDDDLAVVVLTNLVGGSPEQFVDRLATVYAPVLDK